MVGVIPYINLSRSDLAQPRTSVHDEPMNKSFTHSQFDVPVLLRLETISFEHMWHILAIPPNHDSFLNLAVSEIPHG